MIDILDRRAALRALHSDDLAAVEDIAIGISAAYIFLDAHSVLIIIIIDGSTVYPRAEQLPAHLPVHGVASAVIVRQRVAYLVIGDGVSVIGGQQVAPRGVFIAVGVLYSHSCGIRALGLGNIAEAIVRIARHIRSDSYIRIRAVLGYQPVVIVVDICDLGIYLIVVCILGRLYVAYIVIGIVGKSKNTVKGIAHRRHIRCQTVCVVRIALIRIGNSAVVISCVYPESDASEISIGNYFRIFVSAVIVLPGRAESVLIVVAIFVAVRKSVAVVAVALIPALGIVGLLGLRDDNSVLDLIAADESAESIILAESCIQLNYTLSTRFCQIYYAPYNILKNIIFIHKNKSEPKPALFPIASIIQI